MWCDLWITSTPQNTVPHILVVSPLSNFVMIWCVRMAKTISSVSGTLSCGGEEPLLILSLLFHGNYSCRTFSTRSSVCLLIPQPVLSWLPLSFHCFPYSFIAHPVISFPPCLLWIPHLPTLFSLFHILYFNFSHHLLYVPLLNHLTTISSYSSS